MSQHVLKFIKNVCEKDYDAAKSNLRAAINEKVKARIRKAMKEDGKSKEEKDCKKCKEI